MSQSRAKRIRRLLKQALTTEENQALVENAMLHALHKHEQSNRHDDRQHMTINPLRQAKNHMKQLVREAGLSNVERVFAKSLQPAGAPEPTLRVEQSLQPAGAPDA